VIHTRTVTFFVQVLWFLG